MKKTIILASVAIVLTGALETLINQVLLNGIYQSLTTVWRPSADLAALAPIFLPIYLVFSGAFAILFQRAYKGTGLIEGASIGLVVGLIAKFWYGYTNFIVLPIPHTLAFLWFFYGTLECMVAGAVSAIVADKMK